MNILDNSMLTVVLTLAATFLGLSIIVQVLQELYKYLRGSKGKVYQMALNDFIGPLAKQIMKGGILPDLRVRGPFQIKRVQPGSMFLPLGRQDLLGALERTAPLWVQRALESIKSEIEYQSDELLAPSPSWKDFLIELGKAEKGSPGYWSAYEISCFLEGWGYKIKKDPRTKFSAIPRIGQITPPRKNESMAKLNSAFRKQFLPFVEDASRGYSQFEKNYEYSYVRSNKRLTFIIALLLTVLFNLSIEELYRNSLQTDSLAVLELAQTNLEFYKQGMEFPGGNESLLQNNLKLIEAVMQNTLVRQSQEQSINYFKDFGILFEGSLLEIVRYLFGCVLTSIFIAFGAPFWNDIVSAIFRIQKGKNRTVTIEEANHG